MADMGSGQFAETSPTMADLMGKAGLGGKVFRVGEELKVKQSNFTVENITATELILRLVPDDSTQQIPKQD